MLYNIVSIVPQPPGGRGDQRHCWAARGSKGRLLLSAPWSGSGGRRPREIHAARATPNSYTLFPRAPTKKCLIALFHNHPMDEKTETKREKEMSNNDYPNYMQGNDWKVSCVG